MTGEIAESLNLDGSKLRIAIIGTRWNAGLVQRLTDGARRGLDSLSVSSVVESSVPGAYELPFAANIIARSSRVDGIIVVGAVIRGETTHYELVAGECGRGIQDVQLNTQVPIGFGVLTVENEAQALARSKTAGGHNVGEEAAVVAVEMALLRKHWTS